MSLFLGIKLEIVKERGEPACGERAADYGGLLSPPAAAKNVRTNLSIWSHTKIVLFVGVFLYCDGEKANCLAFVQGSNSGVVFFQQKKQTNRCLTFLLSSLHLGFL